jgi:DNA-binding NarL/FixJ family response regulator
MNKEKIIKVHIADDHQILIDGIIAVLKSEDDIEVVGHSLNGRQVLEWFENNDADILVLDINMPEIDGIEVLRRFQAIGKEQATIVLSSYDDIKLIKEVLKIGADGFLAKKCAGESIAEAIRTVSEGEQYFSKSVQKDMISSLSGKKNKNQIHQDGVFISSLTDRELEVLKLISHELSSREIADKLFISTSTVDTYRKSLLKKLKVKNSIGLAMYAVKNNIV